MHSAAPFYTYSLSFVLRKTALTHLRRLALPFSLVGGSFFTTCCAAFFPVSAQEFVDLDAVTAKRSEPYAIMACAAYGKCTGGDLATTGFKVDLDWKTILRHTGAGDNIIAMYERSGFNATIYRNDERKEFVIAYRGTEGGLSGMTSAFVESKLAKVSERFGFGSRDLFEGDWRTDFRAMDLKSPSDKLIAQYVAARSLAARIDKAYSSTPYRDYKLTLTGHSLGAAEASYAGRYVKADVYAIEPARNVLSGGGTNPNQINIILRGDPVSDPHTRVGKLTGSTDHLPGRTYIATAPRSLNPLNAHNPDVVTSRIRTIAGTSSSGPARGVNVDVVPSAQNKDLSDVRDEVLRLREPGF